MGISFKELLTNVGANKVVDPVVSFCWDNSLAEEAAEGDRSPHGRKWNVSFHASEWPDPEYPCPRAAGYQMMDLGSMNTERWLNQTAEVGKAIELAQVRKVRDSGRLARSNVPGTSTDPEARDENNEPMPQIGFIDKEHWLTGSVDLPLMVFNQDHKPHIVEIKSKWVEHIEAMQKGERKADTKHIRQLKCSLGMAHKAKNAFLHPTEDRVLDPPDDGSIYYIARDSPWIRGNTEVPTHEFYFKHDEGFMEEGYANFKIFKKAFLEDVLVTEVERRNSRSHPLGWMWSKGACQYCSFKKVCKADYEAGITTLSDTTGSEEARKTRKDYDPKVVRQDVLDFWDSVE